MKKRLLYLTATIILLAVELFIALYIHDNFIRPYIGDVIVVIVVYTFVRIFIPNGIRLLPLYVFLFAVIVEVLQWFHIVDILGLADNTFLSTLIGGVFDFKDIICYGIGSVLLGIYEYFIKKKRTFGRKE